MQLIGLDGALALHRLRLLRAADGERIRKPRDAAGEPDDAAALVVHHDQQPAADPLFEPPEQAHTLLRRLEITVEDDKRLGVERLQLGDELVGRLGAGEANHQPCADECL